MAESGSSFALAIRLLPAARRKALQAVYAFCHEVDRLADDTTLDEGEAGLWHWEQALSNYYAGKPHSLPAPLETAIKQFGLEHDCFSSILQGMRSDLRGEMLRPTVAKLESYCHRVASCPGLLALPIFGAKHPDSRTFGVALGQALQRINIWRDIEEDAQRGRIYIPYEWLQQAGIDTMSPDDSGFAIQVRQHCFEPMRERVHYFLEEAQRHIRKQDANALLPAFVMEQRYRLLWQRLQDGKPPKRRKRDAIVIISKALKQRSAARRVAH